MTWHYIALHRIMSHYMTLHCLTWHDIALHLFESRSDSKPIQHDTGWLCRRDSQDLRMSESWLPVPCLILTFPLAGSSAKTFTVSWNKKRKSLHATAVASIEWKVHERHWTVFYFGQASPTSCMPSFISYDPFTWRRTVDSVPSTAAYFQGILRDSSIHLTACLCPPVPQHC